jgi:hypothetical protein
MAVHHPPCRVAGRLTPRPIIYSSSHFALLLACESDKEGRQHPACLSQMPVHPTPPMKAPAVSNNANALSCCNPITRRRNPSHVGPHRHSHRDLYQLDRPPPPIHHHLLRQAYFPPSPGGRRCGCPAGKHEAPSSATIGPTPRSFARSLWFVACMNHAPLHIPL